MISKKSSPEKGEGVGRIFNVFKAEL